MPIFWRYFLSQYLKVFILSVTSFVFLLVISRLHETASFASLGAPLLTLFYFILYQFPYILPIAIPISCLLSSFLLMQRLSRDHELTALRSLGRSLSTIITPLIIASLFIAFLNFYIVSEVATNSHLASKHMIQELSSLNPLSLLKNKPFLKRKDAYIRVGASKAGKTANDVLIAIHQKESKRISLFFANKLEFIDTDLKGTDVTFISSSPIIDDFDNLMIENQKTTLTPASEFTGLLKRTTTRICADHLQMRFLLSRLQSEKRGIDLVKKKWLSSPNNLNFVSEKDRKDYKNMVNIVNSCYSELARRLSLSLSPIAFTLLGSACGIEISRKKDKKGIITATILASLFFTTFFLAKSLASNAILSAIIYLFFPSVMTIYALLKLKHINSGAG